jgi:hypothetical protein
MEKKQSLGSSPHIRNSSDILILQMYLEKYFIYQNQRSLQMHFRNTCYQIPNS